MSALSGTEQEHRGARLGLPASGPGSIAATGPRLGAFVVDAIASSLVAAAFVAIFRHGGDTASRLPGTWSLLPLGIDYVIGLLVGGQTLGMYLFRLRVIRVDRPEAVAPASAIVRTVLLFLLVPAIIWDRDGRGLHDRLTNTAVVRA